MKRAQACNGIRAPNLLLQSNHKVRIINKFHFQYEGVLSQITPDNKFLILYKPRFLGKIGEEPTNGQAQSPPAQNSSAELRSVLRTQVCEFVQPDTLGDYIRFAKEDILEIFAVDEKNSSILPSIRQPQPLLQE